MADIFSKKKVAELEKRIAEIERRLSEFERVKQGITQMRAEEVLDEWFNGGKGGEML